MNLRKELMKNKIDIYPVQGKIYNCGGGGQCGTCAVQIIKGAQNLKCVVGVCEFESASYLPCVLDLQFNPPQSRHPHHNSPKSPVEVKALGNKKGDDIRLSCCTRASGDVTVKTKP